MNRQIGLTAALVVLLGACGGAVPSTPSTSSLPSAGSTGPAIASGGGPTAAAPKTSIVQLPSATASATATIPAGAKIDARIQVGEPVAPRWFASDGKSLWVHEPTSLVRVDLATSAITGQVPMNRMEYGYAATGAGAVWQTDFEHDAVVRIDPAAGKVVATIPVGSATARRRRDSGRGVGGRRARRGGHAHRSRDQPRGRDDPDRSDRSRRATDHDGWTRWGLGGRPQHGFGGADRCRDEQGRTAGAAGRPGGE